MSNLVQLRSPDGEIVEVSPKNVVDLVQHHGYARFGSEEEEKQKSLERKAHARRTIKTRDDDTAERAKIAEKTNKKPSGGRKAKKAAEITIDTEDTPPVEVDIFADNIDEEALDELEREEELRGKRGEDE